MDEKTLEWFKENISTNLMFIDLFVKNPFNEFGNKTIEEYAADYGWPSVIAVLDKK